MKIVSWNMNYWPRSSKERKTAWAYLKGLGADYALLQETVPSAGEPSDKVVFHKMGTSSRTQWGTVVVSFSDPIKEISKCLSPYSKKEHTFDKSYPGTITAAQNKDGIVFVSVYGMIENGYSVTTVHRLLSDLTPLIDSKHGKKVVLGGDLNISTQINKPHRARHRNLLERFETLDLVDCLRLGRPSREALDNCPCEDKPCRHVQTHRHPRSNTPWQNDYIFVSKSLEPRVVSCGPANGEDSEIWSMSDHCPLVLELY